MAHRAGVGAGSFIVVHLSCSPFLPHEQLLMAAVGGAVVVVLLSCVFCQLGEVAMWWGVLTSWLEWANT